MSYSYKDIIKIAYPIFLTLLVQNLIQMINTAFLGRVGSVELGASALGGIYYIVIFMLAFGFSTGSQILIGRRNGEQNYSQIGEIIVHGAMFLLLMAIVMIGFTRLFSEQILSAVFQSSAVLHATIEYLDYRIYGLFFSCVNVLFRAFYVGTTRTLPLTLNALIMAVVNIIADYALIFGNFGLPAMGIAGAGLASVIAEATSVAFFIIYTATTIDLKKYGFDKVQFKNLKSLRTNLNISSSLMLQNVVSLGTWFVFFIMIEHLGELPLAVSNIIRSVYMMVAISVFSLAATANTLVSNLIGAGGVDKVMLLVRRVATISFCVAMIVILLIAVFPIQTLRIYTPDTDLLSASVYPLYIILLMMPLVSISNIYFNAVSGTGNTRMALFIELMTLSAYLFYTWLLVFHFKASLALCWTNEGIYSIIIFSLSYFYLRKGKWKERRF